MKHGVNQKDHQKNLLKRFNQGDIEVSCCKSCYTYYTHSLMPKEFCMGCFRMQPKEYREEINAKAKYFRRAIKSMTLKRAKEEDRLTILIDIKSRVKRAPELLTPVKDNIVYKRECLKCGGDFETKSKYTRLCEDDNIFAREQGMGEHTHYMVAGGFE